MSSGLFLSASDFALLSLDAQAEIKRVLFATAASPEEQDEEEEGPANLSVAQARRFLDRCSDRTRQALRAIVLEDTAGFRLAAVTEALGLAPDADLRGLWGGITKRVRTVMSDPDAYLVWWDDESDEWVGHISATSHRSFRKALGL